MTSQTYTLDGPREFSFPFPVRRPEQITVEVDPGGVVPPSQYQVIGASPFATGVTIRWTGAPVDGESSLIISRFTEPDRLSEFEQDVRVTARGLNAEFDNVYQVLQDFNVFGVPDELERLDEEIERVEQESKDRDADLDDKFTERTNEIEAGYQAGDANLQDQLTGEVPLEASAFSPISWHAQTIENSVTIPENKNAWSFGPVIEIAEGQAVTVPVSSFWTVANGEVQ